LKKYVATPSDKARTGDNRIELVRDITEDDIIKLTEIKIKRISKYNSFKADEYIQSLEEDLKQVLHDLEHLIDFSIAYFENLLEKYGKGKDRKTLISSIDQIQVQQVVANNAKLYANFTDGFIGIGMKKDEFVSECSDIDDVIAFTKSGKFKVVRISDKVFIGKDIIHVAVWKKGDERTTYNMIYLDGKTGTSYAKRFNVKSITRDKEYDLTTGNKGSKVLYFEAYPNGETEVVNVQLSPGCSAKKKVFDFDFADLAIKGRGSKGNIVTRYPVRKVSFVEVGKSSLGAIKVWMDEVSGRLNTEERGKYIGAFDTGQQILHINKDGSYELNDLDLNKKYDVNTLVFIGKYDNEQVISAIHYDAEKEWTLVKRFQIETKSIGQPYSFIGESNGSKLYFATAAPHPKVIIKYRNGRSTEAMEVDVESFIDVKGWKAMGNKLGEFKVTGVEDLTDYESDAEMESVSNSKKEENPIQVDLFSSNASKEQNMEGESDKFVPGDEIDLDL
jgi:topoisomerase-4 subunit A